MTAAPSGRSAAAELTVLTYNIKSATVDRAVLLQVLRDTAPDVVVAQEGPNHLRWRAAGARLARETGLLHLDGGRTAGTTMLFARMRIDTVHTWSRRWPTPPGDPIRGLVGGVLRCAGTLFGVVGAHYPLQPEARLRYGEQVVAAVAQLRQEVELVVVCADLNEQPDGPVARQLIAAGLVDSARLAGTADTARATFPAWAPRHRLDTIWCPDGTPMRWAGVPDVTDVAAGSDHLPWLARLAVGSA